MKPCQRGCRCDFASKDNDHCMIPRCVVKRVTIQGKDGDYAYDELTGRLTPWATRDKPKPEQKDPLDQWYEEWSSRQLAKEMQSVDTYARVHGRVRAKRHAVR